MVAGLFEICENTENRLKLIFTYVSDTFKRIKSNLSICVPKKREVTVNEHDYLYHTAIIKGQFFGVFLLLPLQHRSVLIQETHFHMIVTILNKKRKVY